MPFIHEDFLLSTKTARRLYHDFAENEPILDYHCHLPPQDVAENRQFRNLFEIWLEGDHYKWRAMRANGVDERYCTGRRRTRGEVPGLGAHRAAHAAQSALPLDAPGAEALFRHRRTAGRIDRAARSGSGPTRCWPPTICARTASCGKFHVKAVCTTDDPDRRPGCHKAIAASGIGDEGVSRVPAGQGAQRAPAGVFNPWVDRLAAAANIEIVELRGFHGRAAQAARLSSIRWAGGFPTTA